MTAVIALAALVALDSPARSVQPNDNTHPAGRLEGRTLGVSLIAAMGTWSPEGPQMRSHEIAAFGEEGQALSAPGPLIRVKAGTGVSVSLRNTLAYDLTVHGLCNRPGPCDDVLVPAGEVRSVRFETTTPGTFSYWAARARTALEERGVLDSQLGGVIVVDPVEGGPADRIFVLSILAEATHLDDLTIPFIPAINGGSWPYTERLHFTVGQDVRFRVVNLSFEPHAMHLHGFHFQVDARGDGATDTPIPEGSRQLEVTERIGPGGTFAMRWTPTRPGNWLFHCHMLAHMTPDPEAPPNHDPGDMQMSGGMAGLVLGMTVTGRAPPADRPATADVDRVTMAIDREENRYGKHPGYSVTFPGRDAPKVAEGPVPGPVLVAERGRTAVVTIENHTPDPTAIHWHGIELESYYDGVAGFGGVEGNVTPAIAPGGSFVARFTPPRAGTYIYHTHWHDEDQLAGGLYGPLVVLEPGQRFDPAVDHVAVIGLTRAEGQEEPLVLNGLRQPAPIVLRAGAANRLRLINITANNVDLVIRLTDAGETTTWIPRAQDGAALPPALQVAGAARTRLTVGGTCDVEIAASAPRQGLWLEVRRGSGKWELQAPIQIR